ncbi:hypothetical protein K431DRAFT_227093 [Polychaeton citri CBS 116435]|uniref:Uncharacterized protein n=1 Tax=Polychaeton citri CBS 116435 TaxID=1314669 RepID=A0A9P4Q8L9_9PEZI|nr:hypothetical protein K431DRAFT_227093 [Polychaeton citri CBS 116435]
MTLFSPSSPISTRRQAYIDSHPSLDASMEDFEAREFSPTMPDIPSQHSGFRSRVGHASEYSDVSAHGRRSQSPPAWRKAGSGWFRHQHQHRISLSPSRSGYISREASPEGDVTLQPTWIPLPASPEKGRTPEPSPAPEHRSAASTAKAASIDNREATPDPAYEPTTPVSVSQQQGNYIRFSTSLDVIQRTEPIEAALEWIKGIYHHVASSPSSVLLYFVGALLLSWLAANGFSPPINGPAPDLIKVAGLAKSFEPVIYYSEHGHGQIEQLQDTGVAVWDLGESVRSTNMTSAPMIVSQLDDLSESLKTLAEQLTRFFASVDGDIDSILLVMEWAQRELSTISSSPPGRLASVWSNTLSLLARTGVVSEDGSSLQTLFGMTYAQRTKSTLERTFRQFLGVLEEAIENELKYSLHLFSLFEAIDKQFLNLQRTVIREQDEQERISNEFLGALWTRVIGKNAAYMRKFERNKGLLLSLRHRTLDNKHILGDHNQRLLQLKSNLEVLRKKLVSPLVRSENSSTLSVDEQIKGLGGTYELLKDSREIQKRKMMELVYGAGNRQQRLTNQALHIDGST